MKTIRRIAALTFTLTILFCLALPVCAFSGTSARAAILIEASTHGVIYESNADARLPMASTTKIMTALCAVESRPLADKITIPHDAVGVEGSSIYLREGEVLTVEDLLYAVMLASANDAATALAIAVSGSVDAFAELMNARARSLGLENTHFTNPHGLDNDDHYTSARDLAIITAAALENETFRTIASTYKHTIPAADGGVRVLVNHNKLLRSSDDVIGVKTGFTKRSGRCLVTAAERGGVTVIAVTLSDPDDWRDHAAMLEHGLDAYTAYTLADPGSLAFPVPVTGGEVGDCFVVAKNSESLSICVPAGTPEPKRVVELDRFMFAPVQGGDVIGRVSWYRDDGKCYGSVDLYASDSVPARQIPTAWEKIKDFFTKGEK